MRTGGIIRLITNGSTLLCKGSFTYGIGSTKKEAVVGHDSVHGYKELPQAPFIEGTITDHGAKLERIFELKNATVVLQLANGKTFTLSRAWFAGDGTATTEEGEVEVRFEGIFAREF